MKPLLVYENLATVICATALSGFAVWWTESNWGLLGLLLTLNLNMPSSRRCSPRPATAPTAMSAAPPTLAE